MNKHIVQYTLIIACVILGLMPAAAQNTADNPFPITIEHKFGTTTLTEAPQRIVAIGYTEQDFLFALGITPLAVRYWYGDAPNAIFPWAEEAANGAAPEVLNMPFGSLNYEAILALQPDLISAVTAGISAEEYETLSQIAPTIAQSDEYINFGMPWQAVMQMIGDAVGQSEQAAAIIADTEALFADARINNPQFEGKTVAVAYYYGDTYGFYTAQDSRGRFFTELGFVMPEELIEIAGDSFYADISTERVELLDQDLIAIVNLQFIEGGRETLESNPLFAQLKAVQEGRVLYLDETAENALGFSSPLSLSYALEAALPQLEAMFSAETTHCEDGQRLVTHAMGETCVPQDIENVVALEWTYAENLLALGLQPVGMADIEGYKNWVQIPLTLEDSVADVGTRQEPNLEVIASLNPQLILAVNFRVAENYEALSAIAPTLVFDPYPMDGTTQYEEMISTFTTIAQVVGREAEAQTVLDNMAAHFAEAKSALETAERNGETFILTQTFLSSEVPTFRLFTDNALAVQVLEEIGLKNAWDDAPQQFGFSTVDFEGFANVDSTNLFYVAQDDYHATLTELPLWQGLPFVQSGRAYWLGGDAWLFGGPLSMQVVVNTVLESMGITLPAASTIP